MDKYIKQFLWSSFVFLLGGVLHASMNNILTSAYHLLHTSCTIYDEPIERRVSWPKSDVEWGRWFGVKKTTFIRRKDGVVQLSNLTSKKTLSVCREWEDGKRTADNNCNKSAVFTLMLGESETAERVMTTVKGDIPQGFGPSTNLLAHNDLTHLIIPNYCLLKQ